MEPMTLGLIDNASNPIYARLRKLFLDQWISAQGNCKKGGQWNPIRRLHLCLVLFIIHFMREFSFSIVPDFQFYQLILEICYLLKETIVYIVSVQIFFLQSMLVIM
jgi:hypothetical protein